MTFLPGEAIDWPRVHKRIPSGNFLSVTGSLDGERAYMKLREESLTEKIDDDMGGARSLQLLGTPLEVLRIQIEEEVSFDSFKTCFNSLAPGGCGSEFKNMIFELIVQNSVLWTHCEIVLSWMPQILAEPQ